MENIRSFFLKNKLRNFFCIILFIITIFFFCDRVFCLFQKPYKSAIYGWDNSFYYFWVRSFVIDHDFDFRNEIMLTQTMPEQEKQYALSPALTATGLLPNSYFIGWAVSSAPWFYMGHYVTKIARAFGSTSPLDGFSIWYQFFTLFGQLIYAMASLWLAFKICYRLVPSRHTFYAVLLIWLTSSLMFYQISNLSMSHNIVFLAMAVCYMCTLQMRSQPDSLKYWIGIGFSAGFMIICRPQSVVYLLYPFISALQMIYKNKHYIKHAFIAGLTSILAALPQLLAWKILYGNYLVYTYGGQSFDWTQPQILNVFFSSNNGLLFWHPVFGLGLIGLAWFCISHKTIEGWTWPLAFLLTLYINASWYCWFFGAAFGARAFENSTLFAMLGLSYLFKKIDNFQKIRALLYAFIILMAFWNIQIMYVIRKTSSQAPYYEMSYKELINYSYGFWKEKLK
jgi:hypothetical protein